VVRSVLLLGTDAFQETDVVGITQPVTKWNYQITRAEEIPWAIARAFYIAASGRPGPVLLDITKDAQFGMLDYFYKPMTCIRSYTPYPKIDPLQVEEASKLINLAKKPLALIGQGVVIAGAEKELLEFLEKTGIPAAQTCWAFGIAIRSQAECWGTGNAWKLWPKYQNQ
jgi:acetolactate synthase I/II/III large subunit